MNDTIAKMMIAWYSDKTARDRDVQLRAPIDIFAAISVIKGLLAYISQIEQENSKLRQRECHEINTR